MSALIIAYAVLPQSVALEVGQFAKRDIESPRTIVNRVATDKLREEARKAYMKSAPNSLENYEISQSYSYMAEESVDAVFDAVAAEREGNSDKTPQAVARAAAKRLGGAADTLSLSAADLEIFNNIAIAARYLQREHGVSRVAIVDWDVHHGNGTQHSFDDDETVLYVSTHQYPHYPGTGAARETGTGTGKGYTLNLPMNPGAGVDIFRAAFVERIVPALDEFRPEVVLISAGFDAHLSDMLSSIKLTAESFHEFTNMLLGVADRHAQGRIIAFLEGGYDLTALGESVARMMRAFVEAEPYGSKE